MSDDEFCASDTEWVSRAVKRSAQGPRRSKPNYRVVILISNGSAQLPDCSAARRLKNLDLPVIGVGKWILGVLLVTWICTRGAANDEQAILHELAHQASNLRHRPCDASAYVDYILEQATWITKQRYDRSRLAQVS